MATGIERTGEWIGAVDEALARCLAHGSAARHASAVGRWRAAAGAVRFHLSPPALPPMVAVIGGTGTGKSTIVNRLIGAIVCASSFRRTFTSGAIAIAADASRVPSGWLGGEHVLLTPAEFPARGRGGAVCIVEHDAPITRAVTLVDTPDVDGDTPEHHAVADLAFRWAQAVLFLVTPEKYQMTELLPYYRLARRYGVPCLFAMNKCEEAAVFEDYRAELARAEWPDARAFVIPRDDATYVAPSGMSLDDLRQAVEELGNAEAASSTPSVEGLRNRAIDLLQRLWDQVIGPMREARRTADALIASLRMLPAGTPGVDVSPVTRELQRRMQEQSILYLMGPQRVIERVRTLPTLLARLPRTAWDLVVKGEAAPLPAPSSEAGSKKDQSAGPPDFRSLVAEQFMVVRTRIDDAIRSSPAARWTQESADDYAAAQIDPQEAARIVDEEIADLQKWLEARWESSPRDTRMFGRILKALPGGERLARWSEAAPYLLAIIVATHGAFFGHVDLMILGGYGAITWIMEKLSNEVASRTRQTNRRIAERFELLAAQQIDRVCAWLDRQAPREQDLRRLEAAAEELAAAIETMSE